MQRTKFLFVTLILALLVALSALSGVWDSGQAQGTIPVEMTPTKAHGGSDVRKTPEPIQEISDEIGSEGGTVELVKKGVVWGGVTIQPKSLSSTITVTLFKLPIDRVPKRSQMTFQREVLQLVVSVNGKVTDIELTPPYQVYFDLSAYERYMYDNYPDSMGFFQYNQDDKEWVACSNVTFDKTLGKYGRLTCETPRAGFFALGKLAPKK